VTYGYLSVATHRREASVARVRVNNVEVTQRCFAADDENGFAWCFRHDERGRPYVLNGEVAKERLTGDVVIDFPRGLD
jgi:hypothetical protein